MKKDTPWKVAVVGCGSFATGQYLPNISKTANAVLTAVCDIRTDVAEAACKRFGAKEWYGSVEELVEKGGVFAKMWKDYQQSVSWTIGGKNV